MSGHRTITWLITVGILLFSCEASSFRRRHQIKILAVAEGDQDVQPVEKSDTVPSVAVSSENHHSTESIISGGEQEPLTTPKSSQFHDANRLPRTRLLQRTRPSCDSEIIGFQPEKRLTEDQLKMAKLEKETPKVNPVDDSQLESEVNEAIRKVKKSQKLRRQQQKINVEETENNAEEDIAGKAIKSQQNDNVNVQPVENSKADSDTPTVLQGNDNSQLTEAEPRKYRRSSRRKHKKSTTTTTTTTTPPPESEESLEETAENDEDLEYENPDAELPQNPPEHEGSNEETKDEDPMDGPVSKAISGDDVGPASVTALENAASSNEQEQHIEDEIIQSRDKISKKDRRAKSKRGERPNFNDQMNYRQARRRYGNHNDESGDGM